MAGNHLDCTPESMHSTDAAYLGSSAMGDVPVMKARTGAGARGVDGESSPEGLQMNRRIDQVGGRSSAGRGACPAPPYMHTSACAGTMQAACKRR